MTPRPVPPPRPGRTPVIETTRVATSLGVLAVEVVGEGPPALFWHSLCADRAVWSRIRDDLPAHRQLILLDAPGHGDSDTPPGRFTLGEGADAAVAALDALGIEAPVDWVGNAWGGHVGIVLTARDPWRVRTLTTIATSVRAVTGTLRAQTQALLWGHRLLGARPWVVKQMLPRFLAHATRTGDPDAVGYLQSRIAALDRHAFQVTMASVMLDREDLTTHVARLTTRTLFITGSEDALWTPADVRATESAIVDSAVIDGAAHLCALESPTATARAILAHWTRHPKTA
jgi:pimeloyl-ACP methyl ester carboxylesterase